MPHYYRCVRCNQIVSFNTGPQVHDPDRFCSGCGHPNLVYQRFIADLIPGLAVDEWESALTRQIERTFDEKSIAFMGMVCKRWRAFAQPLLQRFIPGMLAFGSTQYCLGDVVKWYLERSQRGLLAVDQFSYDTREGSILGLIAQRDMRLRLSLGTADGNLLRDLEHAAHRLTARQITAFNRMHNKFWVLDGDTVLSGSPNVTFGGMHNNIETMIVLRSPSRGGVVRPVF